MFYDFNGSTFGSANNTAQNFYKGGQIEEESQESIPAQRMNYRMDGDRVPTRERGYRSANQNMRRRDMQKKNLQTAQRDRDMHQINEEFGRPQQQNVGENPVQ